MNSIGTLVLILTPMFIGFLLPKNPKALRFGEKILNYVVFLILIIIGMDLAQVDNLVQKIGEIALYLSALVALTISFGLIALYLFDKFSPCPYYLKQGTSNTKASVSLHGSFVQLGCLAMGFALGSFLPATLLPPKGTNTALLIGLLFLVGLLLKNSNVSLKDALMNKRGIKISLVFMASVLASGLLFALIFDNVPWHMGLALSAGFGWYSISGTIMSEAYGAVWGSVALFNDLTREVLALLFIPYVMRWSSSSAIGLAGVTGLDFTLPILQKSGGNEIIPLIVSFGMITNVVSPILMVFFSTIGR